MSYIIVGLGNPGEDYEHTRHNAGRIIASHIVHSLDFDKPSYEKKLNAFVVKGETENEKISIILPETFMNKSGNAIKPLVSSEKKAEKLIVIYDDLDLAKGTMKMSFDRGSGGHKGLESIIKTLKTRKFLRIRIGISPATPKGKIKKPSGDSAVQKYILGKFSKVEQDILKKQAQRIVSMLPVLLSDGMQKAMSEFNSK